MALWSRLTGGVAAFGIGAAARDAVEPELEPLKQTAWTNAPHRVLAAGTAALARVRGIPTEVDLADDAARTGVGSHRFELLTEMAREYPGTAEALELWRRGLIDQPDFTKALRRAGIPDEWVGHLSHLKQDLLDPGQLAAAIHRGLVPDPGLLKGEQPSAPFNVEAYPVFPIDAVDEAAGSGYDKNRLGVLVGLQGLPMGVIEAAQAYFRKILTRGDYIRAFNESNNRNEWAEAVLEYARQIPTARDFFENALRGYHDLEWAQQEAKRHGMSEADSLVIYQNQGRPMNIRQITQALSRGAKFNPEPGELKDPYDASVVEGNIKPAYYELAKALKYTLPSPFVMRSLTQSGTWSEAKAAKRLKDSGWIPSDADEAAADWAKGPGATADPHVTKAENQLWTAAHRSYLTGELPDVDATAALTAAGVPADKVTDVLTLWAHEANIARKRLTAAQIKAAYRKAGVNAATGQPWTRDEALAALGGLGYPPLQANDYLDIPSK